MGGEGTAAVPSPPPAPPVYFSIDELSQNSSNLANIMAITSSNWKPYVSSQILQKVVSCMDTLNNFYLNTTNKRYNLPLIYKDFSDEFEIQIQETVVDWIRRIKNKAASKGTFLLLTAASMDKDDFMDIIDGRQPPPPPPPAAPAPVRRVQFVSKPVEAAAPKRPRAPPTGEGLWGNATLASAQATGGGPSLVSQYVFDGNTLTALLQNLGYQFSSAAGTRARCLFFAVNNALANREENDPDKAERLARQVIELQNTNPQMFGRNFEEGLGGTRDKFKVFNLRAGYGQDEELTAISELLKIQIKCFSTEPNNELYQKIPQTFVPLHGGFTKTIVLRNHLPIHFDSYIKGTWSDEAWQVQTHQF